MKIEANMRFVDSGNLVGIGDVIIDDLFRISQVKVLSLKGEDGKEKWQVYLPRKKTNDGWSNVTVIKDTELRRRIEQEVCLSLGNHALSDIPRDDIQVRIVLCHKDRLLGYANVLYKNAIEFQNIQIRQDGDNIRIVFPYNVAGQKCEGLVAPMSSFAYEDIQNKVQSAYHEAVAGQKRQEQLADNRKEARL